MTLDSFFFFANMLDILKSFFQVEKEFTPPLTKKINTGVGKLLVI